MHSSQHQEGAEQLLTRVQRHVRAQQQAYVALSFEAQRQRGPCTLDVLILGVMDTFADELDRISSSSSTNRHGAEDGVHAATTSLPFAIRDVPSLARVAALQMRLTSTVMAAISTQAIVTLYDLEEWVCAMEGVETFMELGLGVGLQVLPVVQQYFQLRANSVVFPVRAQDVLAYLLNDVDARDVLLYGGGDARDLLNRFSHFYERTVLSGNTMDKMSTHGNHQPMNPPASSSVHQQQQQQAVTSSFRGGNRKVQNVRQLGVHVQDYAAFLALLAQAVASTDEVHATPSANFVADAALSFPSCAADPSTLKKVSNAATQRSFRCVRNGPLYDRVVQALDATCAEETLAADMRRTHERTLLRTCTPKDIQIDTAKASLSKTPSCASPRSWTVSVHATESEARAYDVPMTMWQSTPLSHGARGGLALHLRVGADSVRTVNSHHDRQRSSCSPPMSAAKMTNNEIVADVKETVKTADSISAMPTNASGGVVRRRRGAVVSGVTPCNTISIVEGVPEQSLAPPPTSPTNSLLSSLLRPAGSLGLAAPTGTANTTTTTTTTTTVAAPTSQDTAATATSPSASAPITAASAHGTHSETSDEAAAAASTPLEDLIAFVAATPQRLQKLSSTSKIPSEEAVAAGDYVNNGVALLERLTRGDVVPPSLICDALRCLHNGMALMGEEERKWRQRRFIPLFRAPATATTLSAAAPMNRLASLRQRLGGQAAQHQGSDVPPTPPSASTSDVREIVYVAAPAEVCWRTWPSSSATTLSGPSWDFACLEEHYPAELYDVFCGSLGVRAAPTLAAWCTAVRCVRQCCPSAQLTAEFTQSFLASFARCVECDVEARIAEKTAAAGEKHGELRSSSHTPADCATETKICIAREEARAEAALSEALTFLSAATDNVSPWQAELFPLQHAWRCGLDGLLYATPQLCGYNGVILNPESPHSSDAPALRVLCFPTEEPSWAVRGALHFCGVHPLDELLETRVTFQSTVNTQASGALHDTIAALVPYMQGFLRARFPSWYALAYRALSARLRHLRIVLTAAGATGTAPVQRLRLHWEGYRYGCTRELRLEYVAAQNILFGTAEDFAVPMLTEALLPLFTPHALSNTRDRQAVREVLAELLGAVSSLQGGYDESDSAESEQRRRAQLHDVLSVVARTNDITPVHATYATPGARDTGEELPFTLPTRPFVRYQSCFPPGTDALRQPRGPPPNFVSHTPHRHRQDAVPSAQRKLHRGDVSALKSAGRGVGGGAAVQVQRLGADNRLRVSLTLPGSGGSTAVVTSGPAWAEFPLLMDVSRVVESCRVAPTEKRDRHAQVSEDEEKEKEEGEEESDSDDENPFHTGGKGDDDNDGEGFLTFQYHRQRPTSTTLLFSPSSSSKSKGGTDVSAPSSRKRSRTTESGSSRDTTARGTTPTSGEELVSAGWYLKPPAASAVSGGGSGDTPGYAVAAERFVFEQLCEEYADQIKSRGLRVIWVNEHTEAGSPFDILIIRPRGGHGATPTSGASSMSRGGAADQWDIVAYVEVKSTCTANRQEFELSLSELLFAARFGSVYKVYRVFGASTDPLRRMRSVVYADLVQMWYRAELTITSEIRVTPSR